MSTSNSKFLDSLIPKGAAAPAPEADKRVTGATVETEPRGCSIVAEIAAESARKKPPEARVTMTIHIPQSPANKVGSTAKKGIFRATNSCVSSSKKQPREQRLTEIACKFLKATLTPSALLRYRVTKKSPVGGSPSCTRFAASQPPTFFSAFVARRALRNEKIKSTVERPWEL